MLALDDHAGARGKKDIPVDTDGTIACKRLADLNHDGDESRVELVMARGEHVPVADGLAHLLVVALLEILKLAVPFAFLTVSVLSTVDHLERLSGLVIAPVVDEPAGRLREALDAGHEGDGVQLHDDDGDAPRPLAVLAEPARHAEVDGKGHVEAKDVHLELLRERLAARLVPGQLARVNGNHGVHAADAQTHDHPTDEHDVEGALHAIEARNEHDEVAQTRRRQAPKDGLFAAPVIGHL